MRSIFETLNQKVVKFKRRKVKRSQKQLVINEFYSLTKYIFNLKNQVFLPLKSKNQDKKKTIVLFEPTEEHYLSYKLCIKDE